MALKNLLNKHENTKLIKLEEEIDGKRLKLEQDRILLEKQKQELANDIREGCIKQEIQDIQKQREALQPMIKKQWHRVRIWCCCVLIIGIIADGVFYVLTEKDFNEKVEQYQLDTVEKRNTYSENLGVVDE